MDDVSDLDFNTYTDLFSNFDTNLDTDIHSDLDFD